MTPEQLDQAWLEKHLNYQVGGGLHSAYRQALAWTTPDSLSRSTEYSAACWKRRLALVKTRALLEGVSLGP